MCACTCVYKRMQFYRYVGGKMQFYVITCGFHWGSGEPLMVQMVHKQRKCLESLICILVTSSTITTISEQLVSKKYRRNGPHLKWSVERLACSH